MDRSGEPAYPRRLAQAVVAALAGVALVAAAPATAQTPGACDQYLPNCDRGDGPGGNNGNQQPGDPSQSSAGPGDSNITATQGDAVADGSGGGAGSGSGAAGADGSGGAAGSASAGNGSEGGPAGLSSAANAGDGDAGGGDLLGTDYPVTGWIVAVLAALAALVLARLGWGAWRRRGGATAG